MTERRAFFSSLDKRHPGSCRIADAHEPGVADELPINLAVCTRRMAQDHQFLREPTAGRDETHMDVDPGLPLSRETRHVAQIAATSMTRILGLTKHCPPGEVVIWWNDIVTLIDTVLASSGLDPCITYAAMRLLERYARATCKPVLKLDSYSLFVASMMVASKIVCPRQKIPWTRVLGETDVEEGVDCLESEFLVTICWDSWMMDIVDEVWTAYDQAVEERRARDPSETRKPRAKALSWASSLTSRTGDSEDSSSTPLPSPLLLSPLKTESGGLSLIHSRTASSLWGGYMSDRTRPALLEIDLDEYFGAAPHVDRLPSEPKVLRTRLSRIFRSRSS